MKLCAFVLFLAFCYVQCRKTYAPIDKNANIAFINMEGGSGVRPAQNNRAPSPPNNSPVAAPVPQPAPATSTTAKPSTPVNKAPLPAVPVPTKLPLVTPRPVNPSPVVNPITTPGPGTVKQLVNFYDSQGKASPIRPYSYSQAVKQG